MAELDDRASLHQALLSAGDELRDALEGAKPGAAIAQLNRFSQALAATGPNVRDAALEWGQAITSQDWQQADAKRELLLVAFHDDIGSGGAAV